MLQFICISGLCLIICIFLIIELFFCKKQCAFYEKIAWDQTHKNMKLILENHSKDEDNTRNLLHLTRDAMASDTGCHTEILKFMNRNFLLKIAVLEDENKI